MLNNIWETFKWNITLLLAKRKTYEILDFLRIREGEKVDIAEIRDKFLPKMNVFDANIFMTILMYEHGNLCSTTTREGKKLWEWDCDEKKK